jgi:phenylalanyl-tRNA synthetase alpha chain
MQNVEPIKDKWLKAVSAAASLPELEQARVDALGKKGEISGLMKTLGALAPD